MSSARWRRLEPPPTSMMPLLRISPRSSGCVLMKAPLMAARMSLTGPASASRISSEVTSTMRGRSETTSEPRISITYSSPMSIALPMVHLTDSAVGLPMLRLWVRFTCSMIASSILSPPVRTAVHLAMPKREMMATSVVPPPMSTIMLPAGSPIGRPVPMAEAMGFSMSCTSRAPADSAASFTTRRATWLRP